MRRKRKTSQTVAAAWGPEPVRRTPGLRFNHDGPLWGSGASPARVRAYADAVVESIAGVPGVARVRFVLASDGATFMVRHAPSLAVEDVAGLWRRCSARCAGRYAYHVGEVGYALLLHPDGPEADAAEAAWRLGGAAQ